MISIVIPTYNHETYIADAITSCLNEPFVSEILIGDDGSSDRTLQIVEEFASLFPNKIRNLTDYPAKNIGAHNRINVLCKAAKNDWLAVLNSDDIFVSGRFRNFEQFVRFHKPDLIFGNCLVIDGVGREIGVKYAHFQGQYHFPDAFEPNNINRKDVIVDALLSQNFLATTSNMIFSRSLFDKLGGFRAYRYIHDWDFALRASLIGNVIYNNAMWVKYRIHTNNTISESSHRVDMEVKRMMGEVTKSPEFSEKIASIDTLRRANEFLDTNVYLREGSQICVLISNRIDKGAIDYINKYPSFSVVSDVSLVPANASYVYAPLDIDQGLNENELINLTLCAAVGRYDFFTCSTVLEKHDLLQSGNLRNYTLVRSERLKEFMRGQFVQPAKGRIIRLPRPDGSNLKTQSVSNVFKKNRIDVRGSEVSVGVVGSLIEANDVKPGTINGQLSPLAVRAKSEDTSRPCVFVFPSVLAVGGAENVLIEILKQLNQEFRFVVICTGRIEPSQGSWLGRTLEYADAVYDLGEACDDDERLWAISWLKEAYEPVGLFLTNSNMWQITNSYKIRRLFRDAAVIDQQAYDYKFGWIEWFDHPGVVAADRFIAVNEKIRSSMIEELSIPEAKIDLIYHPIAAKRISSNLPKIDKKNSFIRFELSNKSPVVAFVGRLNGQKRPHIFLELAKISQENNANTQFVMVGQGELQADVEKTVKNYELKNLTFVRNIPELEYFYCIVDVLVITSEFEGVPLAMLEAMCAGVAILSTDVGGISPVLEKYKVGQVVAPDCPLDLFYKKLKAMLDNISEVKGASERVASQVMDDFSGERISGQYRDSFNRAFLPFMNKRNY
ncbi:glycosyltransferase [Agrobacterium vitis]